MLKNGSYVGVKLQPVTKDKTTFLKIRPHLIRSKHATKKMNKTIQNCFIKVFKFESQKNAKYDKYLDWEIYKFKNN